MDTDVYIIYTCGLCQILLEILHVCDEELLLTSEVLVHFTVLVEYMDHYYFLLQLHVCTAVNCSSRFLEAIMDSS